MRDSRRPSRRSSRRPGAHAALGGASGCAEHPVESLAERHLVHPGAHDCARDRDERRSGLLHASELAEPVRPVAGHERELGQRLDVLDEDSALEGSRRDEGRLRGPAAEAVDERGLLARDEAARDRENLEPDTALAALRDRAFQRHQLAGGILRDGDDRLAGSDGSRGRDRADEHELRRAAEEGLVLVAHRLALGAVRKHELPASHRGHRGELAAGREPGAAAAAEPARCCCVDQVAPSGKRSVQLDVLRHGERATSADAREQARELRGRRPEQRLGAGAHAESTETVPVRGRSSASRHATATRTAAAQTAVRIFIQPAPKSPPVPSPCASASGQHT